MSVFKNPLADAFCFFYDWQGTKSSETLVWKGSVTHVLLPDYNPGPIIYKSRKFSEF
jgi:hypothetical protein